MRKYLLTPVLVWVLFTPPLYAETEEAPIFADNLPTSDHPKILQDAIIFNDRTVIPIIRKKKWLFEHADNALENGGYPVTFYQEVIDIPSWNQILVLTDHGAFEGGFLQVSRYDYMGNLISRKRVVGRVLVLEKAKRLFLIEESFHFMVNEGLIFDDRDNLIEKISYDDYLKYLFDVVATKDEKLVRFMGRKMVKLKDKKHPIYGEWHPATVITLIDPDGNIIKKFQSLKDETLKFEFEGKEYEFRTGIPDTPF